MTPFPPPGDPDRAEEDPGKPGTEPTHGTQFDDDDFDYIEGEIVDDDVASGYGGTSGGRPRRDSATGRQSGSGPFDHPDPFGPAAAFSGNIGAFQAIRMLTTGTPEARTMFSAPLRLLAGAVLAPSLLALLFGFTIDGNARVVAFVVAALGLIATVALEIKRRRFIRVGGSENVGEHRRPGGRLAGLIAFSVLALMLAIGFDLLAVLLQLFGVW